jgi:glycosyltransferase 2 family protein
VRRRLPSFVRQRRVLVVLQFLVVGLMLGILAYVLRDVWADALPRLREARAGDVGLAFGVLALYYVLFVLGWQWILAGLGIRVSYSLALQAEMASMLAKYIPGTVWTPLARIVWVRRAGVRQTSLVLGSILLEAGLSAVAGVLVFAGGLVPVGGDATALVPLAVFAAVVAVLIHPRVFQPLARRVFSRFGGTEPPVLPYRTMVALLLYYSFTWLVGGVAIFFLLRSLGGEPGLETVPYLGGTAAVGAIVTVLSLFAPSGLGVREGSMYGLMLAVASEGVALGATILNRLAITVVEAALLGFGLVLWRLRRHEPREALETTHWAEPELARRRG